MPFPGTTALIPSLATCGLLVAMSNHDGVGTRLLSLTPLPAIGKLSYSLYLWHWPLIVFARLAGVDVKTPIAVLALVSVSSGLAWLSLHYVEEPIRRKRVLTRTPAFAAGLISVILSLVVVSVTTTRTQGLALRFTEPHRAMLTAGLNADGDDRCGLVYRATRPRAATCELAHSPNATRRVLVWGNSHAAMWAGVFASLATEHQASFYLTAKNCRATADSDFCGKAYQDAVLNEIQSQGITDVVLISSWYGAYGIPDADFESALSSIIQRLNALGVRTWISVDIPVASELDPRHALMENPQAPTWGSLPSAAHEHIRQRELALFQRIASEQPLHILDPTPAFCTPTTGCISGEGTTAYYRDSSHLTSAGAYRAKGIWGVVFD